MISKYSHKGLNWVDLESPSESEISHVIEQFSIPPHIQEYIKTKPQNDVIELGYDFTFVSLNVPRADGEKKDITVIANDNFVVTIHNYPIEAFVQFSKEMEFDIIREETSKIHNNKLLLAYLLKNLHLSKELRLISKDAQIYTLEKKIERDRKRLKRFMFLTMMLVVTTIIFIWL